MASFRTMQTVLSRTALAAFAVLAGVVVWHVRPWAPDSVALRPDTGAAVSELRGPALESVLIELLTRIYGAFGETDEFAIYDGLATAVDSDLLTELYLQRRAAQAGQPEDPEGGVAKIVDLALDQHEVTARAGPDYRIAATWTVTGVIGHEDHRHERVNTYAAELTLGPAEGEWRITRFDLDQVERQETPLFFEDFK